MYGNYHVLYAWFHIRDGLTVQGACACFCNAALAAAYAFHRDAFGWLASLIISAAAKNLLTTVYVRVHRFTCGWQQSHQICNRLIMEGGLSQRPFASYAADIQRHVGRAVRLAPQAVCAVVSGTVCHHSTLCLRNFIKLATSSKTLPNRISPE